MKKALAIVMSLALLLTGMVFVSADADVTATVETVDGPFSAGDEIALAITITEWANAYATINISMPDYDESLLEFDGFDSGADFSGALSSSGSLGFALVASPSSNREANKLKSGEVCVMYFIAKTDINVSTPVSVVVTANGYTTGSEDNWIANHALTVETVDGGIFVEGGCTHTGGTATCTAKAVCSLCGEEYGELDAENHAGETEVRNAAAASCYQDGYTGDTYCLDCGKMIEEGQSIPATGNHVGAGDIQYDETDHWYNCGTVGCGNLVNKAPHEGGEATCNAKAECSVCGQEYGDLNVQNHAGGTEVRNAAEADCGNDGYTGDTYCLGCDELLEEGQPIPATGNHTGGTATCNAKAECSVCGKEYGDKNANNHAGGTEVRNASATYSGDTYCLGCDTKIADGHAIAPNMGYAIVSSVTASKGDEVTLTVSLGENTAVGAYEATLKFNDTKLELVELTGGTGFMASFPNKSALLVTGFSLTDVTSGTFLTAKFKVLATSGQTEVDVEFNNTAKADTTLLTMQVTPGVVTIEGSGQECTHEGETEVRGAVAASCYEDGYTGDIYCLDCGEMIEEGETIPATGNHVGTGNYEYDETDHWITCDTVGCGNQTNKAPHEGGTATCSVKAECEICGAEYGELDDENHVGETEVRGASDASCFEDGYTGDTYCLDCGEKIAEGRPIPATGEHVGDGEYQYDDEYHWLGCETVGCGNQVDKAAHEGGTATCSAKAECEVCGAEYGALDAENHVGETEVRNAAEADCGNDGYTGDTYCLDCGEMIEEGQPIPATGNHTGGEATCNAKAECSVCGQEYGDLNVQNHVGGTEVRNAAEADCGNDGYTGDTYCLGCDELLEEGEPIPATGNHTGGEATCQDKAECEVCGQEYGEKDADNHVGSATGEYESDENNHWFVCECGEDVQPAAHTGGEATCKAKAECEVCGAEYGDINANNHKGETEVRGAVPASCYEEGYTGDTYCLDCDEMIEEGEVIPATGNHVGNGDYQYDETDHWKDCDTVGCGNKVNKAPHEGGEATCQDKAVCEVCGAEYGEKDADNHFGGEATCSAKAVCEGCGEEYGEVDADNHVNTEERDGDIWCNDCGEMVEEGEPLPPTSTDVETPTDPTVPPTGDASAVAVAGAVCLAAAAAFVFMKKRG